MNTHKPGVNENFLVTRRLKLVGSLTDKFDLIENELNALIGVNSVVLDLGTGVLRVSYDASKRQLDEIEAVITAQGSQLSNERWQRYKQGWARYFDQNIKSNAAREPWSCH